jgi:hypothetical protein
LWNLAISTLARSMPVQEGTTIPLEPRDLPCWFSVAVSGSATVLFAEVITAIEVVSPL